MVQVRLGFELIHVSELTKISYISKETHSSVGNLSFKDK